MKMVKLVLYEFNFFFYFKDQLQYFLFFQYAMLFAYGESVLLHYSLVAVTHIVSGYARLVPACSESLERVIYLYI